MRPAIDARALLHRITRSPAGFVFGAKAVNAVIGLGLTVVIARALGPMGRAEYFLPSTLAIGVFTAFHLSIDLATFWAIWERSASARAIVRPVARVAALAAIATTVAYLLIGYGFGVLTDIPTAPGLVAIGIGPALLLRLIVDGALWATGRTRLVSWSLLLTAVTQAVAIGVFAALHVLTPSGVLVISLATTVVGCVPGIVAIAREQQPTAAANLRSSDLLRVGAQNHLGVIALWAALRLDVFIVAALVSKTDFGVYTLAVTLAEVVLLATDALALAALGHQGKLRSDEATVYSVQVATRSAVAAIAQGVVLVALAWPVIRYAFGPEWTGAFPVVAVLTPGMVALAYVRPLAAVFVRHERLLLRSVLLIASAAVNVTGTALLVPVMGIVGAAVAASGAYLLAAGLTAMMLRRTFHAPVWRLRSGLMRHPDAGAGPSPL